VFRAGEGIPPTSVSWFALYVSLKTVVVVGVVVPSCGQTASATGEIGVWVWEDLPRQRAGAQAQFHQVVTAFARWESGDRRSSPEGGQTPFRSLVTT
jgi:hypothetical protein